MYSILQNISKLQLLIHKRLSSHFSAGSDEQDGTEDSGSEDDDEPSSYSFAGTVFTHDEYYILLLALIPHIQPGVLDALVREFLPNGGEFPEFGGTKSGSHRGMLPTGETAVFLLGDHNWQKILSVYRALSPDHFFYKKKILWLEEVREGEPQMSGRMIVSREWLEHNVFENRSRPLFGPNFPAKLLETKMLWEDAVLNPVTREQIEMIATWLSYNDELMLDPNLARKIKPGYKVLFYGPPGTGKTLTASLIGKQFNKEVYRIDLSQVVSKYIGETEQNLEKIFSQADEKNWILFFDEADSLFGKRTGIQSSNDRYANQETSYLLQRAEDFSGLMILASNYKNNIDQAFMRRFHQVIHFPQPNADERLLIWSKMMPAGMSLHPDANIEQIARKYEVSGASIVNVIHYAALQALNRHDKTIVHADLLQGIIREFQKEDRLIK